MINARLAFKSNVFLGNESMHLKSSNQVVNSSFATYKWDHRIKGAIYDWGIRMLVRKELTLID